MAVLQHNIRSIRTRDTSHSTVRGINNKRRGHFLLQLFADTQSMERITCKTSLQTIIKDFLQKINETSAHF